MSDEHSKIEKYVRAISLLLDFVNCPPFPKLRPSFALACAMPMIRDSRFSALVHLETVLSEECQRRIPNEFIDSFRNSVVLEGGTDYWTRNPISRGVLDNAVHAGLLTKVDAEVLAIDHDEKVTEDADITPTIEVLQRQINILTSLLAKCSRLSVPNTSDLALGSSPAQSPNLDIDNQQVLAALERRLTGTFEKAIPGTAGLIYIFKYPPNTTPDRIAVKTIDPRQKDLAANGAARFAREIKHWITYRHSPFIISPLYTEIVHGWPYIVMPYCECTLRQYIDGTDPQIGFPEALSLMIQAVAGLRYARQHGLNAHQDLKPENILLQDLTKRYTLPNDYRFRWRARVADFGNANAYLELNISSGSRPYMAPEQHDKGPDLSNVDVFACGVMLYELVTGSHPVGEKTSEIWPKPIAGKSGQWKRKDKWEQWARSDKQISHEGLNELSLVRELVVASLATDPSKRPSLLTFQQTLLETLERYDSRAYLQLIFILTQFQGSAVHAEALSTDDDTRRFQYECIEQLG